MRLIEFLGGALRDLLCDRCLTLVETSTSITVDDLCDRCLQKAKKWLFDLAEELEEAEDYLEELENQS